MKILLKVSSDDSRIEGNAECALVDWTPELAGRIASQARQVEYLGKVMPDLIKIAIADSTPIFYGYDMIEAIEELTGDTPSGFYGDCFMILPDGIDLERLDPLSDEDSCLVLSRSLCTNNEPCIEFSWTAVVDGDAPVHTISFSLMELARNLGTE